MFVPQGYPLMNRDSLKLKHFVINIPFNHDILKCHELTMRIYLLNKTKILCGQFINCSVKLFAPRFIFALRMTRASSRNVGKFYQILVKLFAKNLRFIHADRTENDVTSIY